MKTIKIILLIIFLNSCQGMAKNDNTKALESIKRYTLDEFFKHDYNIEIIDFKINSIKEVRLDSIVVALIENQIWNIAFKIADPTLKNYSDFDTNKLTSEVLDQASHSQELNEYSNKFKKYSHQKKAYVIKAYLKFVAIHSSNFKKNILWSDHTFILGEDFSIIEAPPMFPK